MSTSAKPISRIDQVWIEAKSKIHDVLIANALFSHDFKLPSHAELLQPLAPKQVDFCSGVSILYYLANAYQSFQLSQIYDSRIISLEDLKENNLVLRKGAKALPNLRVITHCKAERVDHSTGEVHETINPLERPYRTYFNYFHLGDLAVRSVPPCEAVLEGLSHPFADPDSFDLLVADVVFSLGIDVVFTDTIKSGHYIEDDHLIKIPKPDLFDDLALFHTEIMPLLILALRQRFHWDSQLSHVIALLGSYMVFNHCLMRKPLGKSVETFIKSIEELTADELFYAVIYAEQASRYLIQQSTQRHKVQQYRVNIALRINNHLNMFLEQDYSVISDTSDHRATLQYSEENSVTF
ncbi:hypothetical protein [Vibrio agarivorans]|uniref:hypothetical protein n=1 Tax=Vibrio agarivorans TaxID=153622 RepID=UPI0025B2EBC1|nr:hypothetical protein [Vibrio agarivorans]MDN3661053.1 hypothetical protein [Vibrio agarivorans]